MTDHDATGRTPLRLRIPADLETPVSAYLKLRDRGAAFLLESVEQGVQLGRYSFIGLGPCTEIRLRGDVVTVTRPDGAVEEHRRVAEREAGEETAGPADAEEQDDRQEREEGGGHRRRRTARRRASGSRYPTTSIDASTVLCA